MKIKNIYIILLFLCIFQIHTVFGASSLYSENISQDGLFTQYSGKNECDLNKYRGIARIKGKIIYNENYVPYDTEYMLEVDKESRKLLPIYSAYFSNGNPVTTKVNILNFKKFKNKLLPILDQDTEIEVIVNQFQHTCEGHPYIKILRINTVK